MANGLVLVSLAALVVILAFVWIEH